MYNATSSLQLKEWAELMELADMQDLGSCAERREGSSPSFRIV